jgi:hypothetical protein
MCSITDHAAAAPVPAAGLAALVAHEVEVGDLIAALLRDPRVASRAERQPARTGVDVGELPPDLAAELCTALLAVADRATAAATVLAGHVAASTGPGTGTLVAGTYASPRRWLELEAGLSPSSAKAVLARARDLREHSGEVGDAWLTGQVTGDSVRELTAGVTAALRPVKAPRVEKDRMRHEALDILLPVAIAGAPTDVAQGLKRMRFLTDPDGANQAAMDAYDDQSLTCVQVGSMSVLTAYLTHESAAAAMTAIDRYARRIADRDPDVTHNPACPLAAPAPDPGSATTRWCGCGAAAAAGVTSKDRWPHLLAVAFGELMTCIVDDGQVGSHHGIAPHVTVTADAADLAAGIGGDLVIPGSDQPVPLPPDTVRRIMCDADITPVVVERMPTDRPRGWAATLSDLLAKAAVRVLYVGRAQRTVPPRLRRALETRDQHCSFPGCRAHVRRCDGHHVVPWEDGGPSDLPNLALLCVRHHHAVHEGGWVMRLRDGMTGHEQGCWAFAPPDRPARP